MPWPEPPDVTEGPDPNDEPQQGREEDTLPDDHVSIDDRHWVALERARYHIAPRPRRTRIGEVAQDDRQEPAGNAPGGDAFQVSVGGHAGLLLGSRRK